MTKGDKVTLTIEQKPKKVTAALEQKYPRDLHKELWGRRDADAQKSLYRWWWEFLRAARDFPAVKAAILQDAQAAKELVELEKDFGELGNDFGVWWNKVGRALFAEDGVPVIQVLKPEPDDIEYLRSTGVVMIVPMTISRELILQQINVMLDIYHPGDELRRHEHSTARRKIFPKQRYRDIDYDLMVKIWRERRAHPEFSEIKTTEGKQNLKTKQWKTPWWEIYAAACGNEKQAALLNGKTSEAAAERERVTKLAEKLYNQAETLMPNALMGRFPDDAAFQQKRRKSTKSKSTK